MLKILAAVTRRFHPRGTERILAILHNPNKRQNFSIKAVSPCNSFKLNTDTASYIEWLVFFKGDYEPLTTEIIRRYAGPDSVSIDVGANVGVHALTMSMGRKVYAFEPEPRIAEKLRANIGLNDIRNIDVLEVALSDAAGTLTLYSSDDRSNPNEGQASLVPGHFSGRTREIMVKVDTIDSMFKDLDRLDLLKIDTEGNDMKVLLGGKAVISRLRPVIIFEWHEPSWKGAGSSFAQAAEFFKKLEYSLFDIDRSVPIGQSVGDFVNILALPKARN